MGNHVGRHYQAPGGVKGVEPSHIVNENTKLVIDANADPTTNGMVSASLEKYFTTIATTNLPRDYNLASGKFFLKEPDDGVSTMPTFVNGSDGSASYWEFDGNSSALAASTTFGTEARFGENFSTGTTLSFWLKESPIAPSGSQFNLNDVTGSDKQRATLFGIDSTAHEFAQDQRSLMLVQKETTKNTDTTARTIRVLNNISGHRTYSVSAGATASLSYFEFHYPKPDSVGAGDVGGSSLPSSVGGGTALNRHVTNPNPNASSSYSGRTSDSTDNGYNSTFDFNMLGKHGTGKGPESGSFLRCLYTTTAGDGATNLELNFKVSCSSNQATFPDFAGEGQADRNGFSAKVWLDHSDSITSASLESMRKLAGNNGQNDDIFSFVLNSGENRTSLYRGGYEDVLSGSFRSGSESHLSSSENPNAPWVNMAFVSEGIISTSLDVTLIPSTGSTSSPTPSSTNLTGSAPYVPAHSSKATNQSDGTIQQLARSATSGEFQPSRLGSGTMDGTSFGGTDNLGTVYGGSYSEGSAVNGEMGKNNGPGFLVGMRNLDTSAGSSFGQGTSSASGSVDTASLQYWQGHVGKDLEVWTQGGSDGLIYKGKHKILSVVPQAISGSVTDGDYSTENAKAQDVRAHAEGFVSIRIGGQFDTQGIMGYGQSDLNATNPSTQIEDSHPQKVRLRVSSVIGQKHKIYKDGKLVNEFEDKGYIINSGSGANGYLVPFQPIGNTDYEPQQHAAWTGSIGETGTSNLQAIRRHDGDLIIGKSTGATPKYWRGKMAHFSIYNQALNDSDVKGNYFALKSRFDGK